MQVATLFMSYGNFATPISRSSCTLFIEEFSCVLLKLFILSLFQIKGSIFIVITGFFMPILSKFQDWNQSKYSVKLLDALDGPELTTGFGWAASR